jgi:hypothetical protein
MAATLHVAATLPSSAGSAANSVVVPFFVVMRQGGRRSVENRVWIPRASRIRTHVERRASRTQCRVSTLMFAASSCRHK